MDHHKKFMDKCLDLGEIALQTGNPPVGSVVVLDQEIIGEASETAGSTGDITGHAEILAIQDAIKKGYKSELKHAVLYTTHEPCVMCSYVIRTYHIPTIIFGLEVKHIGGYTSEMGVLRTESVPGWGDKPEVIPGVCREECEALHQRFLERKGN